VEYDFEWDPVKATENLRKHGVSFERAAQVFLDPFATSIYDEVHGAEEDRWITLGQDRNAVLLVVIHTFREINPDNCHIRLISARRAIKREAEQYHTR